MSTVLVAGVHTLKAAIKTQRQCELTTKADGNKFLQQPSNATWPGAKKPESFRPPALDASPWVNVSPANIRAHSTEFWAALRNDLENGNFWADRSKAARENPLKRLQIGLENLPLPGAFKECAIAIRALIRAAKKAGHPFEQPLSLLYWLAAIHSFAVPYSTRLGTPGHVAMEMASGAEVSALPFTYNELGYDRLELLNGSDVKAMIALWGEPEKHSTLNDMHQGFWVECENRAAAQLGLDVKK